MDYSKTLVILGHPDHDSFCGHLADVYVESARQAGKEVCLIRLGELSFDPVLHHGYNKRQEHEPDLVMLKEKILWATHIVFVYPIWWGTIPALLKGAMDRVLLPGFAFKYRENSQFWDRLLKGRSAHLLVTMDTPPWYYRWVYRMPAHNQMKRTVLEFCGIKPVKISSFGPVRHAAEAKKEKWIRKVKAMASRP